MLKVTTGLADKKDLPCTDPAEVKARALAMCEKLLVNPVMEKASIEVV